MSAILYEKAPEFGSPGASRLAANLKTEDSQEYRSSNAGAEIRGLDYSRTEMICSAMRTLPLSGKLYFTSVLGQDLVDQSDIHNIFEP